MALRYGTALLAVILGLLFGVRPILKALRDPQSDTDDTIEGDVETLEVTAIPAQPSVALPTGQDDLREQVELARRLASEQPERAVVALRRMLAAPATGTGQ